MGLGDLLRRADRQRSGVPSREGGGHADVSAVPAPAPDSRPCFRCRYRLGLRWRFRLRRRFRPRSRFRLRLRFRFLGGFRRGRRWLGRRLAARGPAVGDRRPVLDRRERRAAVPLASRLLAEPDARRRTRPRRPAVRPGRPHPRRRPPGRRTVRLSRRPAAAARGPASGRRRTRRSRDGPAVRLGEPGDGQGQGQRDERRYGNGEAGPWIAAGPAVGRGAWRGLVRREPVAFGRTGAVRRIWCVRWTEHIRCTGHVRWPGYVRRIGCVARVGCVGCVGISSPGRAPLLRPGRPCPPVRARPPPPPYVRSGSPRR